MGHSRLSASESGRWMNCPGSIDTVGRLEENGDIPPDVSSDAAMEGTAAHHVGELCLGDMLAGGWHISADRYRDSVVWVEPDGDGVMLVPPPDCETYKPSRGWVAFVVDDDMILAVDTFVNHVRETLESLGASEDGMPDDVEVEVEAYADLEYLGRDDLGGRIDVRITQLMGPMHVIDYKHGRGIPVHPERNTQLMIYGLGDNVKEDMMPTDVVLTIVQPRCPKNENVASWAIPAEELRMWGTDALIPAAEATDDVMAPRVPGNKQCQWCRAAGHCDAAHDMALTVAADEFPDLPDEPTADDAKKAVMAMGMDKVLRIKAMQPFLEGAIKAAVARIDAELRAGREVPGYKLVEGKSNRRWKGGAEAALKKKRVPASVIYAKKLASFTVIEKAAKGKYKSIVAELVEKPAGKATVAPESDKRPALPPPAQQDFDDLPEDELFT